MYKKNVLLVVALAMSGIGLGFFFSDAINERQPTPVREAVKSNSIDQNRHTPNVSSKGGITGDNATKEDDINVDEDPENDIANELAGGLPDHNLAEYFRYLQTNLGEGDSPSVRTESIRQHLLSTLPSEKAGELLDLYERFTNFEKDAVTRAKEWSMPASADETLELIGKMREYQQEYFGERDANLLFGAEMKVMEYDAKRAIIINDKYAPGSDKEQLLDQLSLEMWGAEAHQAMNQNKDPYDILDEKLLIYGNDLAAIDPITREEEIKKLRAKYLPPGY